MSINFDQGSRIVRQDPVLAMAIIYASMRISYHLNKEVQTWAWCDTTAAFEALGIVKTLTRICVHDTDPNEYENE